MKFKDIKEARHSGGTMSVNDFDVGDKIILTTKMKSGIERRVAKIRSVRRTYVTYKEWYVTKQDIKRHGNEINGMMTSGQGALWPEDIGQNRYGLMHVEIVERGHKRRDGSLRLQEASHHITHPIIQGVNDILKNVPDGGERFSDMKLANRRRFGVGDNWKEIIAVLTSRFGPPIFHGEETDDLFQITVWKADNGREIIHYCCPRDGHDSDNQPIIEVLPTGETTKDNWEEHNRNFTEAKYHNQEEMVKCPECLGKGGKQYPHQGEYEYETCWTCDGRKVIPKKKLKDTEAHRLYGKYNTLKEARYAGQHPFMAKFVNSIWDPQVPAVTSIPDDVEIDYIVKTITQMFGKPILKKYPNIDHVYQWDDIRIPEGVAREGEEMCYIEVYKRKRIIRVNFE